MNETWLVADPDFSFKAFQSHYLKMKSKGGAIYSRVSPENVEKLHNNEMSIIIARYTMFDVLSVYRFSNTSNLQELTTYNQIKRYIDFTRTVIVLGDFIIDLLKQPENLFLRKLIRKAFADPGARTPIGTSKKISYQNINPSELLRCP